MLKRALISGFSLLALALTACNQDQPLQVKQGHAANEQIEFRVVLENKRSQTENHPSLAQLFWLSDAKQMLFEAEQAPSTAVQQWLKSGETELLSQQLKALQPAPVYGSLPGSGEPSRVFSFKASPGAKLSLIQALKDRASVFVAPKTGAINLFDDHNEPVSGDFTIQLSMWEIANDASSSQLRIRRVSTPPNEAEITRWLTVRIENNDTHEHAEDGHSH
jgi:hypothetical protein